jgi:PAS domain S-box-containing protein
MKPDLAQPVNVPLAEARDPDPTVQPVARLDAPSHAELSRINQELAHLQRELARTQAELAAAHQQLAASEQRFRNLSAGLPIGLFELDSAGRCVSTNSYWQAISGLTAEESLGDGWQRVLDPRDAPAFLEERNAARLAGREFISEVRFLNARGDQRWAQVRSRILPAGGGEAAGRVSTVEDITERKQAEAAARATESKLRKFSHAVEQSPVSIVITDLLGGIEYANPKCCDLTGYTLEEVCGKNASMLKSGETPHEAYHQMWATLNAGGEWHGEFQNRKKNGELYWESASISAIRDELGRITHFVAVKEDITQRKRAAALLLDSQQRLELATSSAHIGIWDWDLVTNQKIWDAQMHLLYGLREQDYDGSFAAWQKCLHPGDRDRVVADLQRAQAGSLDYNAEFRIVWPNGEVRHLEAHGIVRRALDGSAMRMIGVNWDITGRKHAEAALQEQLALRERLAKIAANVPGIIYSYRLRPDGTVCLPYASPTIEEFFGARAEDLAVDASPLIHQIHPEDRPAVDQSLEESARTLLPWRAEFRMRHPQKGLFWVEGHSTPEREADGSILWHGFMSDISGRKALEARLEQQRAEHETILNSIGDGVHWIDATGRIKYENPAAAKMLGYEVAELIGRPAHATMHHTRSDGAAYPQCECPIYETLRDRVIRRVINEVFWRKDGTSFDVEYNCTPVYERDGQSGGTVVIFTDITERKRAQAERDHLERRLAEHRASEESARLALEHEQKASQIKDRFVSMVSHEFRTPLSVISIAVKLLDSYAEQMTKEERLDQFREIESSAERMTQMMNDFLVHGNCVSGKAACRPARVEVEALCRRLIAEVPGHGDAPPVIECLVEPAVGEAWLDEKILRHILGNLLSNAVKYSLDGQPVKLAVKPVAGSPQPVGGTDMAIEPQLEFTVTDSGIGIPAADLAKLFQTFHRAANVGNRPGTGMGLAIVKQFVELHRGTVQIESQEGKGTTVWVRLPISPPAAPAGS